MTTANIDLARADLEAVQTGDMATLGDLATRRVPLRVQSATR